jgi:poly-beta-1,6-N-acetyl-D-glucosamine synthase
MLVRYIILSPVRNEAQYLPGTIRSMAAQTVRPAQWILIDDGSNDETAFILDQAAKTHDWITVVHRADRGFRQAGTGVIEAFYDGYAQIKIKDWEFVVKMDGDLSLAPEYFELCLREFAANPKLGIGGGTVGSEVDGQFVVESKIDPKFHVRGATKIYRRATWEAIGGLIRAPGWDTLDEVKANMLGWTTATFPQIHLHHHRRAGEAYGQWNNLIKNGRANYVVGYHPLFMFIKCLRRLFEKPYIIAGFGLWMGFISGYLKCIPQLADKEVIRYFRQQQMNRLLGKPNLWS